MTECIRKEILLFTLQKPPLPDHSLCHAGLTQSDPFFPSWKMSEGVQNKPCVLVMTPSWLLHKINALLDKTWALSHYMSQIRKISLLKTALKVIFNNNLKSH